MRRVVVVGGGIAGLALALELRRRGCPVTVIESRYPGAGNSTRNVGRIRRMQLTADLTAYAVRASDKWRAVHRLTGGRNPLLYRTRYVWVLYDDAERVALEPLQAQWDEHDARARLVEPADVLRAVSVLAGGEPPIGGVIGEAAIVHHDAAVYAYYLAAREAGAVFRVGTNVVEPEVEGDTVTGIVLEDGTTIAADAVVNAAGGRSHELAVRFGVEAPPNSPLRREVLVTEPSRPFMTPAVTFYRPQEGWFNQTLRGELVAGVVDPEEEPGMTEASSLRFLGRTSRILLEKAPQLAELRVVRQWAGVYDTTPDRRPLVGEYPDRPGFYALNGWSGRGILLAPLTAELLARELAGHGRDAALDRFSPGRFACRPLETTARTDYYSGYAH